jgi:lipopolysaccharide transport system ATP-binding protein
VILLNAGKIVLTGNVADVTSKYIEMGKEAISERIWNNIEDAPGDDSIRLRAVRIVSEGEVTDNIRIDRDVFIEIEFWNKKPDANISTSIHLLDKMGIIVLASGNGRSASLNYDGWFGRPHPAGFFKTSCKIQANFLNEGKYYINAFILTDATNIRVRINEVVSFTVHETGEMRDEYIGEWIGVVRPKLEWRTELRTQEVVTE